MILYKPENSALCTRQKINGNGLTSIKYAEIQVYYHAIYLVLIAVILKLFKTAHTELILQTCFRCNKHEH